jgi:hypothetical protein
MLAAAVGPSPPHLGRPHLNSTSASSPRWSPRLCAPPRATGKRLPGCWSGGGPIAGPRHLGLRDGSPRRLRRARPTTSSPRSTNSPAIAAIGCSDVEAEHPSDVTSPGLSPGPRRSSRRSRAASRARRRPPGRLISRAPSPGEEEEVCCVRSGASRWAACVTSRIMTISWYGALRQPGWELPARATRAGAPPGGSARPSSGSRGLLLRQAASGSACRPRPPPGTRQLRA